MEAQFDVYSIITLFGIAQGLFLSVILLRMRRGNRRANRLLALLLVVLSAGIFIYSIIQRTFLMRHLPFLIGWSAPLQYLYGPIYYHYVRTLIEPGFRLKPRHGLHLLPAVACVAVLMPFYLQNPAAKIDYLMNFALPGTVRWNDPVTVAWLVSVVHVIIYTVSAKFQLHRHQAAIKQVYSNIDRINFRWLRIVIPFFSLSWYLILAATIIDVFVIRGFVLNKIIPMLATACFFLFGYVGMLKQDVAPPAPEPAAPGRKYQKSPLDTEESKRLLAALHRFMDKDRPFLEPELTLPGLAEHMGVNRNDLSRAINENTGSNFYDLVSRYRVEEMKRLMADPEKRKLTLLALALEAGFNSKAAFNNAFRKQAGTTPSRYWKSVAAPGHPAPDAKAT
jgi:AraC-like DNA-binding protein